MFWFNQAYEIAEKGVFNKQGLTPLESVYNTSLWDIMDYISLTTAKRNYKFELQEQAHKDSIKKSRKK
jgi:hypothetical protein